MYSLYIPKYQGVKTGGWPLPEELDHLMRVTGGSYDLLVSPGYLSKGEETIRKFWKEMGRELAVKPEHEVGLGLFFGMNREDKVAGTATPVLDANNAAIGSSPGLKRIAVDPKKGDDHRKMIFFLKVGRKAPKGRLDCGNKNAFLAAVTVKAVLIGSSNFSWTTYWNGGSLTPEKGEADLLMFVDERYRADVTNRIPGTRMVLFVSLAGGKAPETYFKEILTDFLSHALN